MSFWELDPNEILLDKLVKKKEQEIGERKLEVPISSFHFSFLIIFLLCLFLGILARVWFFQILNHEKFVILAQANKFSFSKINAERGVIFDRNGEQLTFNKLSFDLYLKKDPKINETILLKVAKDFKLDFENLKQKFFQAKEGEEILILPDLDRERAIIFFLEKESYPYLVLKENYKREYPKGDIFSAVIGYLGSISKQEYEKEKDIYSPFDLVGRDGLEAFYEKVLRKTPGKVLVEKDARGKIFSSQVISLAQPGKNLVLYLDAKLQIKMREEIEKRMREIGAESAGGIAIDPQTGGILGLVSLPTYDNNVFSSKDSEKINQILNDPRGYLLNRVINGRFLLGSTVKPLIAIAALSENIIQKHTQIYCPGFIEIQNPYTGQVTYKHDWTSHGLTDLEKAIAESCNVFFYTIGGGYQNQKGLGAQKIKEYLKKFGLGEKKPEVDYPVFVEGLIGDPEWKEKTLKEPWWLGDTYNLSIGQGFLFASPLQLAQAFLPIANGGKFLKPKFVWKILDEKGNLIKENSPEEWTQNFIDSEILEIVRRGMQKAVTGENAPHASAKMLQNLPVSCAAKTGTAQSPRKNCPECFTVWIVVFAPYRDPKILLVLFFDGVRDISSVVSIPVAFEILNWYFSNNVLK